MNKVIFLDRDGTINVDKGYLNKIEDFEYLSGVTQGLKLLQNSGYKLIIITNQSGIARGYYTEKDFHKLNNWMIQDLKSKGIEISKVYYCPHHPKAKIKQYRVDCNCRKPKLGMYQKAIEEFAINLSKSWTIGDKLRDSIICETTNCRGYLISDSENPNIINSVKQGKYKNIKYASNLYEAAKEILSLS